jgi:hypothetical protein
MCSGAATGRGRGQLAGPTLCHRLRLPIWPDSEVSAPSPRESRASRDLEVESNRPALGERGVHDSQSSEPSAPIRVDDDGNQRSLKERAH